MSRSRVFSGQMSESMLTISFLTVSGGLQDAYSYIVRGGVFANAQTGNVVLMSGRFFAGEWQSGLRYLIPLLAFVSGVLLVELTKHRFRNMRRLHWRQLVVLAEIALLAIVGFIPLSDAGNAVANAIISFSCAMQVQAFRKVDGHFFASTMCIGNLRSAAESFGVFLHTKQRIALKKTLEYIGVILLFALGAGAGAWFVPYLGVYTVTLCPVLLLIGFALMFIGEAADNSQKE